MRVVIIGGGYAGVACAARLAHRAREAGRQVPITLINERPHFVERSGCTRRGAGQALRARPLAPLLQSRGVRLVVGR